MMRFTLLHWYPPLPSNFFGLGLMGGYVFTADDGEGRKDADETYDYKS